MSSRAIWASAAKLMVCRMSPVALDPEAAKLRELHFEPVLRIGAAFLAERDHRVGVGEVRLALALGAVVLLLDLPFDRQPWQSQPGT